MSEKLVKSHIGKMFVEKKKTFCPIKWLIKWCYHCLTMALGAEQHSIYFQEVNHKIASTNDENESEREKRKKER